MGLKEYIVKRVGQMIITYWIFLTILFVMFRAMPGDPTSMYVMSGLSPEARQRSIESMGLDEPLYIQYFVYIKDLLSGDLGQSFTYREPVSDIIVVKFWNTILLMGAALTLAFIIGIFGGALLGWWRGTNAEKGGIILTLVARSSPEYWTGIVLTMVFVFWLDLFPAGGMRTAGTQIDSFLGRYLSWDFVYHAVLPVLTGAIYYSATPTLLMRNSMLDVLNADFITIKKAEGIPTISILYKHAVRNSILPIVTILAIASGIAIGGSIIIETVFNWPGMGREMVRAVSENDYPLAMGTFFLMGSVVIFMNFIADLSYAYLDPRVEY